MRLQPPFRPEGLDQHTPGRPVPIQAGLLRSWFGRTEVLYNETSDATRQRKERSMKGDPKVVKALNELLAEELTAINQYMVHSEMCDNWGYEKLHKAIEKLAFDEMHHAEWLIQRILFLEGGPTVSKLNEMRIGKSVKDMVLNDYKAEVDAVKAYNAAMKLAVECADNGTRDLLNKILKDEESHVDWAEVQRDQIAQMGLENYLQNQVVTK
jgi:bacterioferritin